MIIPVNTDAPIYHFPFACIGIIVINCFAFLVTGWGLMENVDRWGPWALAYGDGLHPVQWITSNFIHMGLAHLIGNMVFLWGFGLVVEGKLGWWRFLLVYLCVGILQCAVEQTIMLGFDPEEAAEHFVAETVDLDDYFDEETIAEMEASGLSPEEIEEQKEQLQQNIDNLVSETAATYAQFQGSCGASAVIYGMLAIALVWAPKNELTVFVLAGFRAFTFEVTIMSFSAWYIGLEILTATFQGFAIASSTLHLMGAAAGFAVGTVMLKKEMVDCEDWDLFAVLSGNYGPKLRNKYGRRLDRKELEAQKKDKSSDANASEKKSPKKKSLRSAAGTRKKLDEISSFIEAGEYMAAADELYNLRLRDAKAVPEETELKELAVAVAKEQEWDEAVDLMELFIESYPDTANSVRLRLANIYLKARQDTSSAKRTLKGVDRESLSEEAQKTFRKLVKAVKESE